VVLKSPSVGTFGGISVQAVEIDDNESNSVTVKAVDSAAFERNLATEASDTGTFRISRTLPAPTPLLVKYSFTAPPDIPQIGKPQYAQHIVDFVELPLTATIQPGETSVDVIVSPKNDRFSEGTELVELVLTPDAAYNVGLPDRAQINLVDNDLVPVQVDTNVSSVVESSGTDVIFTIIRDTPQLDTPLNVVLTAGGTAEPRVDYDPPFPGVVTIPPGSATTTLTVRINDNNFFNPMKTIVLGVSQGPEYKEGFFRTVEVRIFDDEPTPDTVKPSVAILTPLKGARINHPAQIMATGTAVDNPDQSGNVNAAQVRFRLNQGPWNVATLTATEWTADLTSISAFGDNTLDVYSIDEAGNESRVSSVKYVHVKERNVTTNVVGPGTVSADFVGTRPFEVGQSYSVIAKPANSSSMFAGWSGKFIATPKVLTFTMPDEDISLTANFTSVLLDQAVVGKFAGLVGQRSFRRGVAFDLSSSGFLTSTVSKTGRFSAQLNYGGTKYSISGDFTGDGRYIGFVPRKNNTPLGLELQIDLNAAGTKKMTGTISSDGLLSNVDCPRVLNASEAFAATTGMTKNYTFELPMEDVVNASKPQGTGVGTMTLDRKGNVRWRGILPDGTPATQATHLSKDKTWPLFVSNFNGRGMMLGTITHDSMATKTDLSGPISWEKKPDPRDRLFPLGFIIEQTALSGSAYVAPATGQRVLSAFATANGTLTLEAGNLQAKFDAKTIAISDNNKVTVSPAGVDALALSIQTTRGSVSGKFIHPVTSKSVKISGVVLQKSQKVSGNFIGSTFSETALQTGRVSIGILVP
jgi:hypothetical protein